MVVTTGEIHGFLGPNGSGKTTTLRTVLGLVRPNGGTMDLFGHRLPAALPRIIGEVGALVESPQFFAHFSARDTLSLLADAGGIGRSRVMEVLEQVGLRDRAKDRVGTYSLGMKQRLAVAMTLLKQPRLLILDEPANGLDPGGIREMRDLMRSLASSGMTILLSSHILGEIQQLCDSVTIISQGRRVVAGPVADVLEGHAARSLRVRLEDGHELSQAVKVLISAGVDLRQEADHLLLSHVDKPAMIARVLADHGLYVSELTPITPDLESVFLELTGTAPVDGAYRQVDTSVELAGEAQR